MTPAYLFPGQYSGKPAAAGGLSFGTLRQSVDWRTPSARSGPVFTHPFSNPPHTAEPNVIVEIGAPRVVGVVVPIAAAQHKVARVPVAPKMTFPSSLIFNQRSAVGLGRVSAGQHAAGVVAEQLQA